MKHDIIFLNNADMKSLGVLDMKLAIHDAKRAYILTEQGDVIAPR